MASIYYQDDVTTLIHGDALEAIGHVADQSIGCVVTSPPYFGLRDYGTEAQWGLEETPDAYVTKLVRLFDAARSKLADDGVMFVNLGDSYGRGSRAVAQPTQSVHKHQPDNYRPKDEGRSFNLPNKSLIGIPWRFAFAMQDAGWILRNEIIWAKPNGMPASVKDRFHVKHEHIFMFSKKERYWFNLPPWARGDVWNISTVPFKGTHFAVFPPALAERCILAGCRPDGTVLDPFSGSGTTGMMAHRLGRKYVGIDISQEYLALSLNTRLKQQTLQWEVET